MKFEVQLQFSCLTVLNNTGEHLKNTDDVISEMQ